MDGIKRVYLDWAAATPLLPVAKAAMEPWLGVQWGNASAIHHEGKVAREAIEHARTSVARTLEVRPGSVTFTGSGTESNNVAIIGHVRALAKAGRSYDSMRVLTTVIEHPSVTNTMDLLAEWGVKINYVPVDETGSIELNELKAQLTDEVVLVSTHYANSEIGVIQSVRAISRVLREMSGENRPLLHIDAAQAPLWLPCQLDRSGADILTLDASKFQGPQGLGILVRRPDVTLMPIMGGGGQETGLRPGTESVANIVGAAVALEYAQAGWEARAESVKSVRDHGIDHILRNVPGAILNGPVGNERLANNINISIPGVDTEYAVVVLDTAGIAASTKSACAGAGSGESGVVQAISSDVARASSTIRFSLGPNATQVDFDRVAEALQELIARQETLTQT
jgi:cysteine desulfurase